MSFVRFTVKPLNVIQYTQLTYFT